MSLASRRNRPSMSTSPHVCESLICCFLCAGQSLTSVKVKAGEALRLHRTSVGEEAQEEEEGVEEKTEGGIESREIDLSNSGESSSPTAATASSRGVFSTITHAVQNTVSEHTYTHRETHKRYPSDEASKPCHERVLVAIKSYISPGSHVLRYEESSRFLSAHNAASTVCCRVVLGRSLLHFGVHSRAVCVMELCLFLMMCFTECLEVVQFNQIHSSLLRLLDLVRVFYGRLQSFSFLLAKFLNI